MQFVIISKAPTEVIVLHFRITKIISIATYILQKCLTIVIYF